MARLLNIEVTGLFSNNMKKLIIAGILVLCQAIAVHAQNNRLSSQNAIGWYNYFGTFALDQRWGIHTEYQWRRDEWVVNWQQSLLRVGVNYQVNPRVLLRAGYGWIETFAYGDLPINALGRDFTEHRLFQMVQLSHREEKIDISHRFMLEQRFVGRYSSPLIEREDEYPYMNRVRYMLRLQRPMPFFENRKLSPYLATYNELFIGFGKNVNANVFDQNRFGVLLGFRPSSNFRIEGGYLNQVLQFGRQVNGQNIYQFNQGIIINAYFNFSAKS